MPNNRECIFGEADFEKRSLIMRFLFYSRAGYVWRMENSQILASGFARSLIANDAKHINRRPPIEIHTNDDCAGIFKACKSPKRICVYVHIQA